MEKTKEILNKTIKTVKENKWIHYAIIIVIGIILSVPLLKIQIRDTHDGFLHLLRLIGTNNAFKIGEFPPLITPYYCNNGGYAMNLFYNPLVTYIPLLIKLFTPTYAIALKVFGGLCIVLSGIAMYQCAYQITKKRAISLFVSIFYLVAPYKLGDVYKRYAIGEFASFIFMPLLFKGMYSLFNEDGKKHYFIAIGAIGLILTHTVTTFYTAIFCLIYVLFNIKKLKEKEIIKKLIVNVVFILLVSAFFTLPLLEAKQSADYAIFDSSIMSTNGEYVYENTVQISEFFEDIGKENATTYVIGVPIFVLMCLTVVTYKKIDLKYKNFYLIAILFSIISLYMSSKYCPWFIFPDFFCKLQYPWRMMGFFAFFGAFIVGINVYVLLKMLFEKDLTRFIVATTLIVVTVAYTMPLLYKYETQDPNLDNTYESKVIEEPRIGHLSINREYLPTKALLLQRTYLMEREDRIYILNGQVQIENEEKEGLNMTATIKDVTKETILEFPFFYYPGYEITLECNGTITKLKSEESENGFVSAKITEDIDEAKITVKYKPTIITNTSYIVSLISAIAFIVYIIREGKHDKD